MAINANLNITIEDIKGIGQEIIFERYLGILPDFNKTFKNPLREDDSAGCRFYVDKKGTIKFHDISKGYNWDCINVVQFINNCSFYSAIQIIGKDFNLEKKSNIKIYQPTEVNKATIKVYYRKYRKNDLDFWKYLTAEDLINKYNVYAVSKFEHYVRGNKYVYYCGSQRVYAYYFGILPDGRKDIKIYFPDKKENRFIHNYSEGLQGRNLLKFKSDTCVVTKSYKDCIYMDLFNIEAVSPKSETILLTPNQFRVLDKKYFNLISLYDNDMTGKRNAIKLKQLYGITPYIFPRDMKKDFTDNLFHLGKNSMQKVIDRFKEIYLE